MTCGAGPSSAPCCCHLHALSHRVHGLRWSSTVQGEGDGGDGWRSGQPFDLRLASPANSPWMLQKLVPVSATLLPPPITINSITVAGMGNKSKHAGSCRRLRSHARPCAVPPTDRWQRQVSWHGSFFDDRASSTRKSHQFDLKRAPPSCALLPRKRESGHMQ